MRIGNGVRQLRRAWSDAPVLIKGLRVVALPVLALVLTSSLVVAAEEQRARAQDQRLAAIAVDTAAGQVRDVMDQASKTVASQPPSAATFDALGKQLQGRWEAAIDRVEVAALAEPDAATPADLRELRAATEGLLTTATKSFSAHIPVTGSPELAAASSRFANAIDRVQTNARARERSYASTYDQQSRRMSILILVSALLGAASAILAMLAFTFSIRRRVRVLQANAEALGEGRSLQPFGFGNDELGRLGQGLDDAAALLRDRERALQESAETLRQSEQRLSLAADAGDMGTWDVDLTARTAVWDTRTHVQHGLVPDTFGGTFDEWLRLVDAEDRPSVSASCVAAVEAGGSWRAEYRTTTGTGAVRWIGLCGQTLVDADGRPRRLVGVSTDITDRKVGEQKLRAAIADAERANHAKNEFLSRVSHELRTPLNAILGFSQLLEMDDLSESQRESVGHVLSGGRHLLGLIDDVLDISRIESGNLALSMESTSLRDVVAETVALVSGIADDFGVAIEVPESGLSDAHVRADRRRLKQILVNLASNGVKYNRRGGRLTFLLSTPAPGVLRVGVRDTGHGIPAERLDRLFTPFDRLGAEQTAVDGTGIGLALSQRLAEMMGVTLTVESEVGVGSTFSLDVEMVEDPSVAAGVDTSPDAAAEQARERTGTVLYVEDNPSNLRLVQRILDRRGGIRLLSAGTGAIALALAGRHPVDVVLLDLHLPDMNGGEVLRRLREQPQTAQTPIVVVSADATPGQLDRLRDAGADAFLAKPFDVDAFLGTLGDFLTPAAS